MMVSWCSLANLYRALTSICTILEMLHTLVLFWKPFFATCFLKFSIRKGCHCIFVMVLICSVISMLLNLKGYYLKDVHYWETAIDGINIITAFVFLYSYMRKKIYFSVIIFYWFMMVVVYHIVRLFSPITINNKIKLVHALIGSLYLYFAGVVVSYIQGFNLIQQLKKEQLGALDEWENMELGDMFESKKEAFKGSFMFPFPDLSHHLQNHKEAEMLDRVGRGRW